MDQGKVGGLYSQEWWDEKAAKELNETIDVREKKMNELREMIDKKGGLVRRSDDESLLRFLRAKKFHVLKAFNMMERYEVITKAYPELYDIKRAAKNLDIYDCQGQEILEGRDRTGAKIFVYRVGRFNISQNPKEGQVSVDDLFRYNMLLMEWCALEEKTQIAGVIVVADLSGFKLATHAILLSPYYSRRTVEVIQESFPLRFKGIHIVNQPLYFDALFAVVKPFLKDKIKERIFLHGNNFKSLHRYISPEVLPAEYDGKLPQAKNSSWKNKLIQDLPKIAEIDK